MNTSLGRYLYGLAAIGLGIGALIWPSFIAQLEPPFKYPGTLVDCFAIVQIAGGIAILFAAISRAGAIALGIVYGIFTLLWLPLWARHPLVFDSLGNAFEQFAMCCGALVVLGAKSARIGYVGFGICVISFAIYQAVHLQFTAELVPKWIPPGQMFWSVATTVAFGLAAIALLTGRSSLLAAQLTAVMIFGFGVLIWVPATISAPHAVGNWSELGLNFGICGAAWIVADYLAARRRVTFAVPEQGASIGEFTRP